MKNETLEEAAEKEFPLIDTEWCRTDEVEEENLQLLGHRKSFIKGAKWQAERMYSDEDLVQLLNFVSGEYNISNGIGWFHTHESNEDVTSKEVLDKWFEQFKKK
jgi:hypothetical protein